MKGILKKWFSFFVYSNLFIVGCAALMVFQTSHLLLNQDPGIHFLLFVCASTLCSYSFHWYLTDHSVIPSERIHWLLKNKKVHAFFFIAGLAASVYFFTYLADYWQWLLPSVVATFSYSAPKIPGRYFRYLRKVAIGKTIFLAFVWMYVTTVLPVVATGAEWKNSFYLFAINRFFFIYAICILFDYRDRDDDKADGVRSLITFLNSRQVTFLFIGSLVIFGCTSLLMLYYKYPAPAIILLLVPGIITAALYHTARRNFSDMLYYFVLDGLMALSALLMLIAGI